MCTVLLPPGANPTAVNKYIDIKTPTPAMGPTQPLILFVPGILPGRKAAGPHLVPSLRISGATPPLALYSLNALTGKTFTLTLGYIPSSSPARCNIKVYWLDMIPHPHTLGQLKDHVHFTAIYFPTNHTTRTHVRLSVHRYYKLIKDQSSVETQLMFSSIWLATCYGLKTIHQQAIIQNK
jgi:hypothetical protein